MELRMYEMPEPSHIHVSRPSRADEARAQLSAVEDLPPSAPRDEEVSDSGPAADGD
jgi:hypothetical protein